MVAARPNLAPPQPNRLSTDAPSSPSELCRGRGPRSTQVGRQPIVEPQQIRVLRNVADDVVGHDGFPATGKIASHPRPPAGVRLEQSRVDGDCQAFLVNNIPNSAQTVLPPPCYSVRIKGGDVELNPWGRQIDEDPVE